MCCSLSLHNRFVCSQWFFAKCMMSICHGAPISSCLAGAFHFLGILGTTYNVLDSLVLRCKVRDQNSSNKALFRSFN